MNKQTQELKDLDVDRIDGVDRPATGRSFLLFKSEGGADAVLKSLGLVSTAASVALAKMRADKSCTVSKDTAVAMNGVAQILGEAPVFVDKAVATQPYEIKEDVDVDSRGPADEKLGSNFVARSIGSVTLKMKEEDEGGLPEQFRSKAAKAASAAKTKAEAVCPPEEDKMPPVEAGDRGIAARMSKMESAIEKLANTVQKAIDGPVQVEKAEGDEPTPVRKVVARSKQIEEAEPVQVKKNSDLRMGVSFANIAFSK